MSKGSGDPVILLAEDNENDVLFFRRAFRDYSVDSIVHVVNDGEQAIEYLKGEGRYSNRDEYPLPTLMLLDLKMPRKDGFEVLQWVRGQPALRGLLVVVLTTSQRLTDVNRAYQLGANSFLTKPLDLNEFRVMVQSLRNYWLTFNQPPAAERPKRGEGNGDTKQSKGSASK